MKPAWIHLNITCSVAYYWKKGHVYNFLRKFTFLFQCPLMCHFGSSGDETGMRWFWIMCPSDWCKLTEDPCPAAKAALSEASIWWPHTSLQTASSSSLGYGWSPVGRMPAWRLTHTSPRIPPPSMAGFSYLTHNYLQPAHLPHFTDSDFEFVRVSDFKTKEGETTQTCPEVNSSLNVLTA